MSQDGAPKADAQEADFVSRRQATRLSTVYGGRICQHGKAYACVISDLSEGGAKVRLKDAYDFGRMTRTGEVQLIFERLSEYRALNGVVAWLRPEEQVVGVSFTDPNLRRRVVIKRLMPNRWNVMRDRNAAEDADDENGA